MLHIWADGKSYDVTAPREPVPDTSQDLRQCQRAYAHAAHGWQVTRPTDLDFGRLFHCDGEEAAADAWDEGVRQAMTWLRADYPYGTGPEWRENGAEWIADRLAEHHRAAVAELRDKPTKGEQS